MEIVQADGLNAEALVNIELPLERGIAGMAWLSREVEMDADLKLEIQALCRHGALTGLRSAVAIPLMHESEPFAVLVLYTDEPLTVDPSSSQCLRRSARESHRFS